MLRKQWPTLWKRRARWLAAIAILSTSSASAWAQSDDDQPKPEIGQFRIQLDNAEAPLDPVRVDLPDHWIGLRCDSLDADRRAELKLGDDQGLIVQQVLPESPAAKAGIKDGDVLVSAKDKDLTEPKDLVDVVADAKDNEFEIKILRDGKEQTIKVTPAKRPEPQPGEGEPRDILYRFFGQGEGDQPIRMRFIHPGMLFPPAGLKHELPDDVKVEITKEGKKPAKIVVHRGDKTWTVAENELKELPEDLRPHIAALSGNLPMPGPTPFNVRVAPPMREGQQDVFQYRNGPGPNNRIERQLEEMNRRMRELREEVDRIRDDRPRRERGPRDEGDAGDDRRRPEPPPRRELRDDDGPRGERAPDDGPRRERIRIERRRIEDRLDRAPAEDDRDQPRRDRGGDA
jgi:hypothetical protein